MTICIVNKHGLIEWCGRLYRNLDKAGQKVHINHEGPEALGFTDVTATTLPIGLKG
jgi:hypothetical protein